MQYRQEKPPQQQPPLAHRRTRRRVDVPSRDEKAVVLPRNRGQLILIGAAAIVLLAAAIFVIGLQLFQAPSPSEAEETTTQMGQLKQDNPDIPL